MYRNTQQSFDKYYSSRDVFECTSHYWALEDEFYYLMTLCNRFNEHTLQTMMTEYEYRVNESKTLLNDLRVLGVPVPCRCARTMDRNKTIQLHKTLNYIQEENNQMTIQRNKYFMLKELLHTTSERQKSVDLSEVAQLLVVTEYKSDIEMSNENTEGD